MARTYKFLIIHGVYDVDDLDIVRHGREVRDRISQNWEESLRVVECRHEIFEDNCVELYDDNGQSQSFVQSVNTTLYYWEDMMTRFEIVEAFE